jgi:hypothetical protein
MVWGTISSLGAFAEGVGTVLNYPLLGLYEFMVLPGQKTKKFNLSANPKFKRFRTKMPDK